MSMPLSYITTTTNLNDLFKSIRKHDRMNLNIRVALELYEPKKTLFAQTSDISLGGMACYIPTELNVKDELTVVLQIPYSKERLYLKAVVRNRNSFRYGLEFTEITPSEQDLLQKCMTTLQCMQ